MIIIIAIIVIIIAIIGIASYRPPPERPFKPEIEEEQLFKVEWNTTRGSLSPKSGFAGKKTPYETTISITQGNLKNITFNLTWTDDKAPLFGRFGLDTLTLEVIPPDGEPKEASSKSAPRTKEGNVEITLDTNWEPPISMEAKNDVEARKKLNEEPYYSDKWVNKDFKIKVTVDVGEIRLLKRIADKGNNFELKIKYEYYVASIEPEETRETGSNDPFGELRGEEDKPPFLSMIIGTGCGRYI
jgi:hypothetical protein